MRSDLAYLIHVVMLDGADEISCKPLSDKDFASILYR